MFVSRSIFSALVSLLRVLLDIESFIILSTLDKGLSVSLSLIGSKIIDFLGSLIGSSTVFISGSRSGSDLMGATFFFLIGEALFFPFPSKRSLISLISFFNSCRGPISETSGSSGAFSSAFFFFFDATKMTVSSSLLS